MKLVEKQPNAEKICLTKLGSLGRMLCGSKSIYRYDNPDHFIIFNANVFIKTNGKYKKVWYGDLDITNSFKDLLAIHKKINKDVFVLYEMDGRFESEKAPKVDKAALSFLVTGKETKIQYNTKYFYLKNSSLYEYTTKELEEKYKDEKKQELEVINKKDFVVIRSFKLPDLSKYKVNKSTSPVEYVFKSFITKFKGDKKKAEEIFYSTYISEKYTEKLKKKTLAFIKKTNPHMHPAHLQSTLGWAILKFFPCSFHNVKADWVKDDMAYLRKDNKNE